MKTTPTDQADRLGQLELDVQRAVEVLVEAMGCESFVLPLAAEDGSARKFIAFGTEEAIGRLLTPP